MSKTDALLYAEDGIRVNSIHPGYIWTPLVENLARDSGEEPEDFRRELAAKHPIGRMASPEEVAAAIAFLASDDAAFITGVALPVDGGRTVR